MDFVHVFAVFTVVSNGSCLQSTMMFYGEMVEPHIERRKDAQNDDDTIAEQSTENEKSTSCLSNGTKIFLAWILFSFGLCIIMILIYLAICENNRKSDSPPNYLQMDKTEDILRSHNLGNHGCQEQLCKIICTSAENFYKELYDTLELANCTYVEKLLVQHQNFSEGIFRNSWKPAHHLIYEVMLENSNITSIYNGTFNEPMFTETFMLSWYKLNLTKVESGALLGLRSLQYLMIETFIPDLDLNFLRPVQATLKHLKLNAGLKISKMGNIFETSHLYKLEYLDLSGNYFSGPITKSSFDFAPNINFLILRNAHVTSVRSNALAKFIGTLQLLDLSNNALKSFHAEAIEPLLIANNRTQVNLTMNDWDCDCRIRSLAHVYIVYRNQFVEPLYCRVNISSQCILLNEFDFGILKCATDISTLSYNALSYFRGDTKDSPGTVGKNGETVFQVRCINSRDANTDGKLYELQFGNSDTDSSAIVVGVDTNKIMKNKVKKLKDLSDKLNNSYSRKNSNHLDYFHFEPPMYDFNVELLQNNSAKITINEDISELVNIIWFSEQMEDHVLTYDGADIDYNCVSYKNSLLITSVLIECTTYTFCLIPLTAQTITPFNCLPLHVPKSVDHSENVWISQDSKQFTVGMLCMIFTLSIFFGAVIAYCIIKSYPDLLEGSKNVLVIKKPEQTRYVSTISEREYLTNSLMRRKLGDFTTNTDTLKTSVNDLPQYNMSTKPVERLSSLVSNSTCFEDAFMSVTFADDEYEMPRQKCTDTNYDFKQNYVQDNIIYTPSSPPPLPKRN